MHLAFCRAYSESAFVSTRPIAGAPHTHAHAHPYTHAHARAHAHAHTHTRAHAHTHAHVISIPKNARQLYGVVICHIVLALHNANHSKKRLLQLIYGLFEGSAVTCRVTNDAEKFRIGIFFGKFHCVCFCSSALC